MKFENFSKIWKIFTGLSFMILINVLLSGCAAGVYEGNVRYYDAPAEYNIDELNQYGQWVEITQFGRVWQPSVVADWQPFQNGHWIYSNDNWTWVSYEPFGWIVYHYGYWFLDDTYGWVWIPQNNGWSPATVRWCQFDDYISWAPLNPPSVTYVEPWEEKEVHYWHTVKMDSFQKDKVGTLQVPLGQFRNDNGSRGATAQPPQPQNVPSTSRTRTNSGDRTITRQSPTPNVFESRTGQKVNNVPTVNVPVKTSSVNLHKITLPDSESKRIVTHQQEVQKNVLVPKKAPDNQKKNDQSQDDKRKRG